MYNSTAFTHLEYSIRYLITFIIIFLSLTNLIKHFRQYCFRICWPRNRSFKNIGYIYKYDQVFFDIQILNDFICFKIFYNEF
jgi:hypothetical protein